MSWRKRHRARGVSHIVERYKTLPVLDDRPTDELLEYDGHGLPA